jgi:hypothetical protein
MSEPDRADAQLQDESNAALVDENAYGIWVSWFDAEQVEYSQSADKFAPRIQVFRSAVREFLSTFPLGKGALVIELGTAVYVEIGDGDQSEDLIGWLRSFRAYLGQGDWTTFAVLSHGGRWVSTSHDVPLPSELGGFRVLASMGPSEPLRKAMAAEALAHDDEDAGVEGWGSGTFVDSEALEAMGRKLKNQPTALRCAGTDFFRIGS